MEKSQEMVPRATFRLISDNHYACIDNCLKFISLVTMVKCFKKPLGFEKVCPVVLTTD